VLLDIEIIEGLIERLHAELCLSRLHDRIDSGGSYPRGSGSGWRNWDHDLEREHAASAILGINCWETTPSSTNDSWAGPAIADGGEYIDDAVHRLSRGVRMERREGQMSCLGDGQCRLDGLQVPHLADEHDIRVLPENILRASLKDLVSGSLRAD